MSGRSAFSKKHFQVFDRDVVIPDVITIGGLEMLHESEKLRTNGGTAGAGNAGTLQTGVGRYLNISGNSEPTDPYFEFVLTDESRVTYAGYVQWEHDCRLNLEGGSGRDFTVKRFRNEDMTTVIMSTHIYNATCKKVGVMGDSSSKNGADNQIVVRVDLECEHIEDIDLGGAGTI